METAPGRQTEAVIVVDRSSRRDTDAPAIDDGGTSDQRMDRRTDVRRRAWPAASEGELTDDLGPSEAAAPEPVSQQAARGGHRRHHRRLELAEGRRATE